VQQEQQQTKLGKHCMVVGTLGGKRIAVVIVDIVPFLDAL
jgi:hypothetical protein